MEKRKDEINKATRKERRLRRGKDRGGTKEKGINL
jgi:hypothetical protein